MPPFLPPFRSTVSAFRLAAHTRARYPYTMALFGGIHSGKRKDRVTGGLYRMRYGHLARCAGYAIRLYTWDSETALERKGDLDRLAKALGGRSRAFWETCLAELSESSHSPRAWRAALAKWGPEPVPSVLDGWRAQQRPGGVRRRALAEKAARQIVPGCGT